MDVMPPSVAFPMFPDVEMADPATPFMPPKVALIEWRAGAVRCGGAFVEPRAPIEPRASPDWSGVAAIGPRGLPRPVAITFRIDTSGRPLGITRETDAVGGVGAGFADSTDIEPTLALVSFAAGTSHASCRMVFTPQRTELAQATPRIVIGAMQSMLGRPYLQQLSAALVPSRSTCTLRRVMPRAAYFPALDTLPMLPGIERLASVAFDIDADGTSANVRTIFASDRATQAAAEDAVSKSRFAPAARTGCLVGFGAPGATLAAPLRPDLRSVGGQPTNCPPTKKPKLTVGAVPFPEPFRRRNVEGWALIAYDIAPWGAVGNASVISAEPAAAFGEQAKRVVMAAKAQPSPTGFAGCIAPVRFQINEDRAAPINVMQD